MLDAAAAAGHGRPGAAAAGRLEPALERGEVHARGAAGRGARSRASDSHVEIARQRHRPGHRAGVPAARLRALPPGRREHDAPPRRLGLGLAIVRHLVELHGGTVARRERGRGQRRDVHRAAPARRPSAMRDGRRGQRRAAGVRRGRRRAGRAARARRPAGAGRRRRARRARACCRRSSSTAAPRSDRRVRGRGARVLQRWRPDVLVSRRRDAGRRRLRADPARPRAAARTGGRRPAAALTAYARTEDRARALDAPASRSTSPSPSSPPS